MHKHSHTYIWCLPEVWGISVALVNSRISKRCGAKEKDVIGGGQKKMVTGSDRISLQPIFLYKFCGKMWIVLKENVCFTKNQISI